MFRPGMLHNAELHIVTSDDFEHNNIAFPFGATDVSIFKAHSELSWA